MVNSNMPQTIVGWDSIVNIFSDLDLSVLYSWMPSDIQLAIVAGIGLIFVIAVIGIVKRFLLR